MSTRENTDIKPVLLKVGLALTLSLAGFFYSRIKVRRIKHYGNTPSGHDSETNLDRAQHNHNGGLLPLKRASSSCTICSLDNEEPYVKKVIGEKSTIGPSPRSKHKGVKDGFVPPDFDDLLNEMDFGATILGNSSKKDTEGPRLKIGSPPKAYVTPEMDDYDQEVKHLRSIIRMLQDRERSYEVQLLEYYGLREKETAVMELQNQLKISGMEAKMSNLKVDTLVSENRRLEALVADHAKVMAELEISKGKVKLLKKKIKYEAAQNRQQIKNLQEKVLKLQDHEDKTAASASNPDIQMKLQKLKDLESQTEELKKYNLKLQMENSELARRLESTQILANAIFEDPQADSLKEETERLKQENESLTKEIERLQDDRCSDVEELVYMRWINACLRHELRNYQPPPGKTVARDLSKSLSPTSEKKAKQLILEYANSEGTMTMEFDSDQWSTSQSSSHPDYADGEDSSVGYSSVPRPNTSNKKTFLSKLRRLIKGKDDNHNHSQGEKSGSQYSNSPQFSMTVPNGNDAVAELHRSEFRTSPRMSRSSSDWSSLKYGNRSSSDSIMLGSSEKFKLSKEDPAEFKNCLSPYSKEHVGTEKSPLVKFAEVLRDSGESSKVGIGGRRRTPYSSF